MTIISHLFDSFQIDQTSSDTQIGKKLVPSGYVNATQMAKANGKKLNDYLRLKSTSEYVTALSVDTGIPVSTLLIEIEPFKNDYTIQGTWVHLEIALDIAKWCSVPFRIWANRSLRHLVEGNYQALTPDAEEAKQKVQDIWTTIRKSGIASRRSLTDSIKDYLSRHPEVSDEYRTWIYLNTTDLMYSRIFGMKALALEEFLGCGRHQSRDYLSAPCVKFIDFVETAICHQIDADIEPKKAVMIAIQSNHVQQRKPEKKSFV